MLVWGLYAGAMSEGDSAAHSQPECAGCRARDQAAAQMISSTMWWLVSDRWPIEIPPDPPAGLREAWFASDAERFGDEWGSWTGGLGKSIRSTRSEVRDLQHIIHSFVRTSLERMDEALPPESTELAVMKAVTGWLTGEIGVPAAVAAVWSDRDGKRTWAEWDGWLWEQLRAVPTERLWPATHAPASTPGSWSYWELVVSSVVGQATSAHPGSGGESQAAHVMRARAALHAAVALNDESAMWRAWSWWLSCSLMALEKRRARASWEQYAETLPAALRAMAKVEPTEQAEVAALTFELGAAHGYDLYLPPDPPKEQ